MKVLKFGLSIDQVYTRVKVSSGYEVVGAYSIEDEIYVFIKTNHFEPAIELEFSILTEDGHHTNRYSQHVANIFVKDTLYFVFCEEI